MDPPWLCVTAGGGSPRPRHGDQASPIRHSMAQYSHRPAVNPNTAAPVISGQIPPPESCSSSSSSRRRTPAGSGIWLFMMISCVYVKDGVDSPAAAPAEEHTVENAHHDSADEHEGDERPGVCRATSRVIQLLHCQGPHCGPGVPSPEGEARRLHVTSRSLRE